MAADSHLVALDEVEGVLGAACAGLDLATVLSAVHLVQPEALGVGRGKALRAKTTTLSRENAGRITSSKPWPSQSLWPARNRLEPRARVGLRARSGSQAKSPAWLAWPGPWVPGRVDTWEQGMRSRPNGLDRNSLVVVILTARGPRISGPHKNNNTHNAPRLLHG